MAFRRAATRTVLTSAASRIINADDPRNRALSTDARELYGLYDRLGQIRAGLQFKAMAASKIDYYPARKLDPGESPERTEDEGAVEAFERLRGPLGEFADFVSEFCLHLDIAGEGFLIGDQDDQWDVWSAIEYEEKRQAYQRSQSPDAAESLNQSDFVLRVWRPHPMKRELPDSPLRAIEAECLQYMMLRGMLSAVAESRFMAGILKVPEGLSFPPKANGDPSDDFFDSLFEAISAAVGDPSAATRLTPTLVQGDADMLGALEFMDLGRDLPEWVPSLMERVLRQIATGLDLPADILLGLADVNHWNAWLSEDSAKLDYVDPLVLLILDSLTRGYLHPTLTEMGVADSESYLFWRDYSDLIARAVGTGDAINLYDRGIISEVATRRVVGFTDADMPDADAPADLPPDFAAKIDSVGGLIRAGFDPEESLLALGLPLIAHSGLLPVTVQRPEDVASVVDPIEEPAGPDSVSRGTPPIPQLTAAGQKVGLGQIDHRLYAQISEAAQAALDRTLERAGAKIRRHVTGSTSGGRAPKHPQMFSAIDGVPNGEVGWTLGKSIRETLQLTDSELVPEDSFDALGKRVVKILEAGQDETYETISRITDTTPERNEDEERGWREIARDALLAALGALALRKLFTPDLTPDPAETGEVEPTQIPAPIIFDSLTLAGGGAPGFGPEAPRGLANGAQSERWLVQAGFQIREREWTVGSPAMPFEPHRALRGTRFQEWTDPALSTPITAGWLGVSFMFPGDHSGCQCVAELVVSEEPLFSPVAA